MMQLTEDILSPEETETIGRIFASDSPRFDLLVALTDLDPLVDFTYSDLRGVNMCGADLRGFNFTGSDLRRCAKNSNTKIDETTIFEDAQIEWVDLSALPIVMKMQEIEVATSSDGRVKLLSEMIGEFGKSRHVVTYMVKAASNANSLDEFLDFAGFLPSELTEEQGKKLRQTSAKLLKRRLAQSKSRTRRDATTLFTLESIAERLKEKNGTLAGQIFTSLAEIVNAKQQTRALGGMANIEREDVEKAFGRIGR